MHAALPPLVTRSRALAVATTLALITTALAWELWLAPLRPGGSWWALKALPLALALPGLVRSRMYTHRWLALAVWLYVIEGLVRATTERMPAAGLAWLQTFLAVLLFAACAWHVRGRLALAAGAEAPPAATAPGP